MKRIRKRKWIPVLITLAACATTAFLLAGEEEESLPEIPSQPLSVETLAVQKTDYRIRIPAWGFVEPRETIAIRAEISGKITDVPTGIFTGAPVPQDTLLFSIDDRNYRNSLAEAIAAKKLAQQALKIEKGRQTIARNEWKLLKDSKWQGKQNKALALREPQLKEREAAVQIAAARQAQAALDVERTRITAPCEGVILGEHLAKGRILDTGDVALQIACTDCYHVMALFSPEYSLAPEEQQHTAQIDIGSDSYEGIVKAVLPQISSETRQKQALVEFSGETVSLGAYASLTLPGPFFRNVVLVPKAVLRPGNTVWVLSENNTLEIRTVTILAQDVLNLVIDKGIEEGDRIVLSHIASPLRGMRLCMKDAATEDSQYRIRYEEQSE